VMEPEQGAVIERSSPKVSGLILGWVEDGAVGK